MSQKEIKDQDLQDVSGGAVDLQLVDSTGMTGSLAPKTVVPPPPPPVDSGGSGGPGAPGINDLQQNNDGSPASGA